MTGERLHHVAVAAHWAEATAGGAPYLTSTRGRTLAEEGFTHCARADQVAGVLARFYGDVDEPLVLLVVERDRLRSPVVDEVPEGGDAPFPHVYGPLDHDAVVEVWPIPRDPDGRPLPPPALSGGSAGSAPST